MASLDVKTNCVTLDNCGSHKDEGSGMKDGTTTIIHVLGKLNPSGMERMLVSAAEEFALHGVRGIVVAQGTGHRFQNELAAAGYEVHVFPNGIAKEFARFRRMVRSSRPDVIHIHTEASYLLTVVSCWIASDRRVPLVRTVHNVFLARGWWRVKRTLQAAVADRLVRRLVAPSPDVVENERRFLRRPLLIYNWVDAAYFDVRQKRNKPRVALKDPTALIVGNCSRIKNHELALSALARAGWSVLHLGDESGVSDEERRLLENLAAAGAVKARGVTDPQPYLLEADAFLMPSRNEGMSVALAEALVSGVPCLVANSPGLQWAAEMPGTQLLQLEVDDWVSALRKLESGAHAPSGASHGDEIDFSPARGVREYLAVYGINASSGNH